MWSLREKKIGRFLVMTLFGLGIVLCFSVVISPAIFYFGIDEKLEQTALTGTMVLSLAFELNA